MSEQQTFGEWLKAKRGRKFTQDELAEAADNICTGAYISTLERGVIAKKSGKPIRPDEAIVEALAKALGESVSEARIVAGYSPLPGESSQPLPLPMLAAGALPKQAIEIIAVINALPDADRTKVMNALNALYGEALPQYPVPGGIPIENGNNKDTVPRARLEIKPQEVEPLDTEQTEPERKRA